MGAVTWGLWPSRPFSSIIENEQYCSLSTAKGRRIRRAYLHLQQVPLYRFRVRQGKLSSAQGVEAVLKDGAAAWHEAAQICADLARDIMSGLKAEPEWLMEVTDETGVTLFTFRFTAEISPTNLRSHEHAHAAG
jgi:hypothetical protein